MYSPKIREDYIRQLYLLKQVDKRPTTQMVNEAIAQYLLNKQQYQQQRKEEMNERK
jgi:hypothetical protein